MFSDGRPEEEVEMKERHSFSSVMDSSSFRNKITPRKSLDSERFKSKNSFQLERKSLDSFNLPQRKKEPTSRFMNIIKGKRKIIHVRNFSLKSPRTVSLEETVDNEENNDELPPLEEQEELSEIGLRRKENSFVRISKDYRERFRLDPRFYFFLHLFWILSVGFFGGTLIYYVEMPNTQTTFIDSIFTSFSAVTVTGLFVINFPTFTLFSKVVIFFCIRKHFESLKQVFGTVTLTTVPLMIFRCFEARKRMKYLRALHPEIVEEYKHRVDGCPPPTDIEYLAYKYSILMLFLIQGTFQLLSIFILSFWLTTYYSNSYLSQNHPLWISTFLTLYF
jgi:hypothetical protein